MDGVSCGILAKYAFGDEVEVRYNSIGSLNIQVEKYLNRVPVQGNPDDLLLITDLSVNSDIEKRMDLHVRNGGRAYLIDHHKTALHFNDYEWAQVHVQHHDGKLASATSLLYEYLIHHQHLEPNAALDQYVEWVRLYDTWEWEIHNETQAKRLNDLFYMISLDDFESRMIERLKSSDSFSFDEFEEKILDMEEDKIERYIRRKRRELIQTFIGEECVGIVYAESYHSELASELGGSNPHLDYIAILNMGGRKMSLRTIHDHIDVSAIAMRYGGGGHAKASGCTMGEEVYRLFAAEPFELDPLPMDAMKNQFNIKGSANGALYEAGGDATLFLFRCPSGDWAAEWNGERLPFQFPSFEDAERHIKRQYGAWLARDEAYVSLLSDHLKRSRNRGLAPDHDEEKIIEEP
nr:oligoribonuclease [Paenibacillus lemnae]